jgi:hypothetical protein
MSERVDPIPTLTLPLKGRELFLLASVIFTLHFFSGLTTAVSVSDLNSRQ